MFKEYEGGYDDWRRQFLEGRAEPKPGGEPAAESKPAPRARSEKPKKLSYKEQQELDGLPAKIAALEAEQQSLHDAMAAPGFYQQGAARIAETSQRLESLQKELTSAYERWEALETIATQS